MLMFQKVKMNFITSILFLVLWFCSVTIPIHGEKQGYKMFAFDEYLDFHINKIRMKRQAPSEGPVQTTLIDSITTGDSQNLESVATQESAEITHLREENRKLNRMIYDLRIKNANLEERNSRLQRQYQDILVELQTVMDAKLSLELENAAYRLLLDAEPGRVDNNLNNITTQIVPSPHTPI